MESGSLSWTRNFLRVVVAKTKLGSDIKGDQDSFGGFRCAPKIWDSDIYSRMLSSLGQFLV